MIKVTFRVHSEYEVLLDTFSFEEATSMAETKEIMNLPKKEIFSYIDHDLMRFEVF